MSTPRVILHLDMDAFYASIEQRDHPALRGKPVIVGSPPTQRRVVSAANYEARKFGIRSAMPSVTAGRLCPRGIFVPPRMSLYREESRLIMEIIGRSGAAVEPMSIDEAYLDVSGVVGVPPSDNDRDETPLEDGELPASSPWRRAIELGMQLKTAIRTERQLTATIGIASNKLLAKIASDFQKPDGLTVVPEPEKAAFLRPLPVRVLFGVGRVTETILADVGIKTVGNLQDYSGDLRALVGSFGPRLKQFAFGVDDRPLELGDEIKSISSEETFGHDTEDRKILRASLKEQARDIAAKLIRKQLGTHTVQVKVRYSDFTTLTRQITVEEPISEAAAIYRLGCFLLARDKLVCRPVRLIGLGASSLTEDGPRQLELFKVDLVMRPPPR